MQWDLMYGSIVSSKKSGGVALSVALRVATALFIVLQPGRS